jgi:hypothetical protein
MNLMETIEYRVRPVTRYIVTRFAETADGCAGNSSKLGEYDNDGTAFEVAYALCRAEHERLGWPLGDERIKYPSRVGEAECVKAA